MPISNEYANLLLDFYEVLLTDKARDVLSLYYREDLSLSEIAEELEISRSAVSDQINRSVKSLQEYENKMGLLDKYRKRLAIYQQYEEKEEFSELIQKLKEME